MQITNHFNCLAPNKKQAPNFCAWNREVAKFYGPMEDAYKEVIHRNDTYIYRTENLWKWLMDFAKKKYEKAKKVNVYIYGCSDGSEAYSLLIEMFANFKENFMKKFLPITAKDYDPVAIEKAKKGILAINAYEKDRINTHSKNSFDKYFELNNIDKEHSDYAYKVKPILKDKINFSECNVLDDIKGINPENSMVFVRNFWPYLNDRERELLAKGLNNQMKKNGTIIIGDYDLLYRDYDIQLPGLLIDAGFRPTKEKMVFQTRD